MCDLYERLKKMRIDAGFRQEQIAEYLGVTQTFISKVESGERNLSIEQLNRIVNLYGYSLSTFINNNELTPIRFSFRAQDVCQEDLCVIADISKIALNSRLMTHLLEESND